jgi:hypothetical protein
MAHFWVDVSLHATVAFVVDVCLQVIGCLACAALFYAMVRDVSDWDAPWKAPPPEPQMSSVLIDVAGWLLLGLVLWYIYPRQTHVHHTNTPTDPPTHTHKSHGPTKVAMRTPRTPKQVTVEAAQTPKPPLHYVVAANDVAPIHEAAAPDNSSAPRSSGPSVPSASPVEVELRPSHHA